MEGDHAFSTPPQSSKRSRKRKTVEPDVDIDDAPPVQRPDKKKRTRDEIDEESSSLSDDRRFEYRNEDGEDVSLLVRKMAPEGKHAYQKVAKMRKKMEQHTDAIRSLTTFISSAESTLATSGNKIDRIFASINRLATDVSVITSKLSDRERSVDTNDDLSKLLESINKTMLDVVQLQKSMNARWGTICKIKGAVNETKTMSERLVQAMEKQKIIDQRARRNFCVQVKSHYEPLFLGGIGTYNSPRLPPLHEGLNNSAWDCKTSKPMVATDATIEAAMKRINK